MRLLEAIADRLGRSDMLQGVALLFVALGFALVIQWPSSSALANQAWFTVAPVRLTLLSLGVTAWGAGLGARPRKTRAEADGCRLELPGFGSVMWWSEAEETLGA